MNPTPLRKAIYARLAAALAPVEVWSQVPQDQPYPYVRIGRFSMANLSPKDGELNEYEVQIHAFTRDKVLERPEPVEAILSDIHAALNDQDSALTLESGRVILIRCEFSEAFQPGEPQADYWHGVQRYRILTQDT